MVLARERGVVIQVLHLVPFLFLFFSVRPIQSFSIMAGNFRDLESMPNEMDLLAQDISLRPNCLHYKDLEQYLDTQYRLLRLLLQSTTPICWQIHHSSSSISRRSDEDAECDIYRNCCVVKDSFLLSQSVPDRPDYWRDYSFSYNVPSTADKRKILISESMVALFNDFNLIIFAQVLHARTHMHCTLSFHQSPPPGFDQLVYTMLECPVFFEPYRVVMEAYQQMDASNFPPSPYILGWTKAAGVPDYLKANLANYRLTLKDGTVETIKDVMTLHSWPSAERIGVNEIQREALHAAMTHEVALIQGPPGTGKSFIGRKIVTALLDNQHVWQRPEKKCPIVVICLTNHALDQFLEGILANGVKVIRLGAQSK